jgi:uncharacterized membrane protein
MTEPVVADREVGRRLGRRFDRAPAWQVALAFLLLATLYAAVSIQQYRRMDSYVFDLGFFESVLRDYAHGHLPHLHFTDTTTAPLHFSPALAVLAPVVLVWPSPVAVLVSQALLVAVGVVPLMRAAVRGWMAWAVAVSYGLAPGFSALFGFDFHEVALGVPLLAFSMAAMVRGQHRSAVLWALPLVLVKEDLGLTVAAIGFVVLVRGSRRWGAFAMVFGVLAFVVTALWLPHVTGGGFAERVAPHSAGEAWTVLGEGVPHKLRTVLFLLLPTGFVALRSPMLLLAALPTLGWRFLSVRWTYWDPWYQYDAVLVPIAVAAMIEGAVLLRGRVRQVGLGLAVAGTLVLLPQPLLGFHQVWDTDFWRTPARTAAVDRVLERIPDGSRVAASDDLGARIALRTELYLMGDTYGPDGPPLAASHFDQVQWLAVDTRTATAPVPGWRGFAALLYSGDFEVVAEADGVVVARRTSG